MQAGIRAATLSLFNIRESEERIVGLLLLHSLFYGGAVSFVYVAALVLFLEAYSAAALPWAYIAAAVVVATSGLLYSWLAARIASGALFLSTVALLASGILFFRFGLLLTNAAWLTFGVLIWYRLIYSMSGFEYWGVANRVLTLQQGKRLFGLIGAGDSLAKVIGYALIPILVGVIGTANLLVIAAFWLFGSMFVLSLLRKLPLAEASGATLSRGDRRKAPALRPAIDNRYVGLIARGALLTMLLYFLIDFGFLQQVRRQFSDSDALASFLALFSGLAYAGSLLLRTFLSNRLLQRYGLRFGLLVLPVGLMLPLAAVAVVSTYDGYERVIFLLMVITQLLNHLLGSGIYQPSFQLLYQALDGRRRMSAQAMVEGMFQPLGAAMAGISLLTLQGVSSFSITPFATVTTALTALWLLVLVITYRHYLTALQNALMSRSLEGSSLVLKDAASLAIIERMLDSHRAAEVIYALQLLRRADAPAGEAQLAKLLAHGDAAVQRAVLDEIEKQRLVALNPHVQRFVDNETNSQLRAAALRVSLALNGSPTFDHVAHYLTQSDPLLRDEALVGLLRHGNLAAVAAAREHVLQMAASADALTRQSAASVIGRAKSADFDKTLRVLLDDVSAGVRHAALLAAAENQREELWLLILEAIESPADMRVAAQALTRAGNSTVPLIEHALATQRFGRIASRKLAQILGQIGTEDALHALTCNINFPERDVRVEVHRWLSRLHFQPDDDQQLLVQQQFVREINATIEIINALDAVQGNDLLLSTLRDDLDHCMSRLFSLLTMLYDHRLIESARDTLYYGAPERCDYAVEVLDNLLSLEHKRLFFPLLEWWTPTNLFPQIKFSIEQSDGDPLLQLIKRDAPHLSIWTKACILYSLDLTSRAAQSVIEDARHARQPLLREAAASRLASDAAPGPVLPNGAAKQKLSTLERLALLKRVDIFQRCTDADLAEIAQRLQETHLAPAEVVFEHGQPGSSLYIIVLGCAKVHIGEKVLNHLKRHDVFGEMALLDSAPRMATVTAVEELWLLCLDQQSLYDLMEKRSELSSGIIRMLIGRLRARVAELNDVRDALR